MRNQTQTKPESLENYLELLTISLEHVWELDSLPYHHRNPFDRLSIAQGQADGIFGMYAVELLVV